MGGTTIAQAMPVLVSPLLTRLFRPEHFGIYAIFSALASIGVVVAALRYEMAVMRPEREEDAAGLYALSVRCAAVLCTVLLAVLLAVMLALPAAWNEISLEGWILLVPFSIFSLSVFSSSGYWLNRRKRYASLSKIRIVQGTLIAVCSVLFGLVSDGPGGLIGGTLVGQVIAAVIGYRAYIRDGVGHASAEGLWGLAREYKVFPTVSMPSALLNTVTLQAPTLVVSHFYLAATTGFFNLAFRVLAAPVSIIAQAIGQVYYQRVAEQCRSAPGKVMKEVRQAAFRLALLAVVVFSPVFLFGHHLFGWVFGSEWTVAGDYAEVMVLSVAVKFVVSPLSSLFVAADRQRTVARWQIAYFASTAAALAVGVNYEILVFLWVLVINDLLMYGIYFLLIVRLAAAVSRQDEQREA